MARSASNRLLLARGGYTLLELLLVLTVLVVLASIAWPSMQGLYERNQLKGAAEEVRAHLARARLRAIDSGLVYAFRYEVGGRGFESAPAESGGLSAEDNAGLTLSGELPEDMRFERPDAETLPSETSAAAPSATTFVSAASGSTADSPLILFLPDGSATEAVLDVADSEDRFVQVAVRGLTGGIRVGEVMRRAQR